MKNSISFFLPTRKGSQRVLNKNTRKFASYKGGLIELKLQQLVKCKNLAEIILSTNDEDCIQIAKEIDPIEKKIKVIKRPEHLCLDTTPLKDLIEYVPKICNYDHILWGHVTTPFANSETYDKLIKSYFKQISEGFDSLISVSELKNFLIDPASRKIINYDLTDGRWPRTQDLKLLYEVNHAVFIASKDIYLNKSDRIGSNPFYYIMDKIQSFDIDWKDDFLIAESIFEKLIQK